MKKTIIGLAIALLVFPELSFAQTQSPQALAEMVAKLQSQLAVLQAQIKNVPGSGVAEEWKFNYSKANLKLGIEKEDLVYDEDDVVNLFKIQNNRLYWDEDGQRANIEKTDDAKMWNIFAAIAGEKFINKHIEQYATYRFDDTSVLGFAQLISDEDPEWRLALNAKAANLSSEKWTRDLVSVFLHEYAHILTLNLDQTTHNKIKQFACKGQYLSNMGCSTKKSYINAFATKFWDAKDLAYTGSYEDYYKKHKDDFITKYAPKSPEEDIAESFTQFILYEKPTGTKKKDLKVSFFYEYPELVELRTRIRGEIKQYFVK